MITWTHHYREEAALARFLSEYAIVDGPRLLVQVMCGVPKKRYIKALQRTLNELIPQAVIIGATTDGAICEGEMFDAEETVILFSQFEATDLACAATPTVNGDSYETGRLLASELGSDAELVITFTDGLKSNGEEYLNGLNTLLADSIIAGGMASDNGRFRKTLVFTKDTIYEEGAVAVALKNPDLKILHDYTFNWMPIGKQMRVTKAEKNRVMEIEGMPAAKVYGKYLGKDVEAQLPQVGVEFPLILQRNGVNVGRAVKGKHRDGSLIFAGNVHENELVQFGIGNADVILRESGKSVKKMQEQPVESIFVYSCMARKRFLGEEINDELAPLQHRAPTAGFFTYGEFFSTNGEVQLLNETMTMVALSEGGDAKNRCDALPEPGAKAGRRVNQLKALAHLANVAAGELEVFNETLEEKVREASRYMIEQLYIDRLTQLPNRTKLITKLGSYNNKYITLINIDDFATLNDFYGHRVGDFVLESLAKELQLYADDAYADLYRMPGDEFALVYNGEVSTNEIEGIVANLSKKLNAMIFAHKGNEIHLSVSMSAALITPHGSGMAMADMTLKQAKRQNLRFLIHHETMLLSDQYEQNLNMAKAVREALKHNRVVPYFQPILDLHTGEIAKYECLARLIDDDGSVIAPFFFLPVAHKIHLYPEITKMIVSKAFERFAGTPHRFTINLSLDDIIDPPMREFLFNRLKDSGIGKQVTFEILETKQLEDEAPVLEFIKKVQAFGACVAIDDFGSGFANFENLTRIEADFIKIDGSLIKAIDEDQNAKVVVETIVTFAKKLGMKTVAEYVHSEAVLQTVKELGIDYAQGFLLGKPEPEPQEGSDTVSISYNDYII
jgi:diguanylate cyclase (GGDEF)-like protein